jgi:CRP-like cAMP-binding protein
MKSTSQAKSRNQILANLRSADFSLLEAFLGYVELRVPKQLESPNKRIDDVYFIESGFASVVANGGARRQQIEIGLIGREGMTGLAVLMGNDRSPIETYMQLAGAGLRITAEHLREAIGQASLCIIRFCAFRACVPRSSCTNGTHQRSLHGRAAPVALAIA